MAFVWFVAWPVLYLLLDTGSFAMLALQVVQSCPSYLTYFQYFDLINRRGYDREYTLYANAVGDLAHGECFAIARVLALDHCSLELLNTLLVPFLYLYVNVYRITGFERRMFLTRFCKFLFYEFYEVCHNSHGLKIGLQM